MGTVGIVGYGRFGAALGGMLREAGEELRAFDPSVTVPEESFAPSLEALARASDTIIVAVPVQAMDAVLVALRPALTPAHVVLDVGSVKVLPTNVMAARLGRDIPWVATHPLFGPVSLRRGERPLRVVVCPNALHAGAVTTVESLLRRIGCEIVTQDADAHDRTMAMTHALAFFVAKGMIDAGAPTDLVYVPPSFQAIERVIEAVRADAGHLFATLHTQNPYAADARRALLDALSATHASLAGGGQETATASALAIPDLGATSAALGETRELIDEVDRELVALLARRAVLARRAASAKAEIGVAVRDPRREAELLAARRREAERAGLDGERVGAIFEAILAFSRGVQGS